MTSRRWHPVLMQRTTPDPTPAELMALAVPPPDNGINVEDWSYASKVAALTPEDRAWFRANLTDEAMLAPLPPPPPPVPWWDTDSAHVAGVGAAVLAGLAVVVGAVALMVHVLHASLATAARHQHGHGNAPITNSLTQWVQANGVPLALMVVAVFVLLSARKRRRPFPALAVLGTLGVVALMAGIGGPTQVAQALLQSLSMVVAR